MTAISSSQKAINTLLKTMLCNNCEDKNHKMLKQENFINSETTNSHAKQRKLENDKETKFSRIDSRGRCYKHFWTPSLGV